MLRFLEQAEGRALPSVLSEITGISDRTLRKKNDFSPGTIKKAQQHSRDYVKQLRIEQGFSKEEVEFWLAQLPGISTPGMFYSDLVYSCQIEGYIAFPHTLELAIAIDRLSTSLAEARQRSDLAGFKEMLLNSPVVSLAHFAQTAADWKLPGTPPLLESLRMAQEWTDADQPLRAAIMNTLFSLLAHWDVEFYSRYFPNRAPRSCFAMVLPRLDPKAAVPCEGQITKRRGMFAYPVRRLIDLIACLGVFVRKNDWPDQIPKVRRIALDANEPYQNLVNWRDGTKSFTKRDFVQLWKHLCPDRESANGPIHWPEPSPIFAATMFWQSLLVQNSTTSKEKSILLFEDIYLLWWAEHLEALKAKGTVFGASPWPACFNEI